MLGMSAEMKWKWWRLQRSGCELSKVFLFRGFAVCRYRGKLYLSRLSTFRQARCCPNAIHYPVNSDNAHIVKRADAGMPFKKLSAVEN